MVGCHGWYYRPGDPHTGQWKELGFDFATLQPNYAFNNVSAKERFPAIHDLADNFALGVELELDINIRNPQVCRSRRNDTDSAEPVVVGNNAITLSARVCVCV